MHQVKSPFDTLTYLILKDESLLKMENARESK